VSELANEVQYSQSGVVADYRGLTVAEMETLRQKARQSNVYVRVIKNTLAKQAVEGTNYECLQSAFQGPVLIALSKDEPNSAARMIREFKKKNEKLEVKALALNGRLYGGEDLDKVADLPSKDEAIAQLLSLLKTPMTQLTRTLAEPQTRLARVVASIRDQKQAA